MSASPDPDGVDRLSYARGVPLAEEQGLGALTLGGYLSELVTRYGPREAAVMRQGEIAERWTYAELWDRSVEVARALVACGVGRGGVVAILMTNRLEFLSAVFGAALAGGVAAPISTFSTAAELDEILKACGCSVLLAEPSVLKKDFAAMLGELEPKLTSARPGAIQSTRYPFLEHVALVDVTATRGALEGWRDFLACGEGVPVAQVEARAAVVRPSDPGALFFSSGSTGKAKGILSAHRGVCLQLWRWKSWYDIEEPPRTWSANGFFFSGNFAMALGGTLSSGGTLVLQRWFEPQAAIALVEAEKVSMPLAWPHQWPQIEAAPNYATADLSSLRYIDAAFSIAKHPSVHSTWREPRAYGATETFTLSAVSAANTPDVLAGIGSGRPTGGSTLKIVDPETGRAVPLGERGEIAVKGPTFMLGYLGVPLDEVLDDEGFFHTKDGGFLDDQGRLVFEGRLNDMIKTGGANVSPSEVDEVLRRCPGVKASQTVGVPDPMMGEIIVACVQLQDDAEVSEDALRQFARQYLASYKVPKRVLQCTTDDFVLTGSAKIKLGDLRDFASKRLREESCS